MSENLRFSNAMCKLLKKREKRFQNCHLCSFFNECNDDYTMRIHRKEAIIKMINNSKGLLSYFDFEQQFKGKK